MIPKSLTIKGLYSYQTEQTIDFTQLAEANVFGIFGKVGAGKSSILEAILYALYGEVERLDSRGRSYNMMNLSVSDFYIVFDFEIAGKLYRSKATGRRNSRQRDDVKIDKPQFFELVNGNFTPLSIATAEPLLRLNVSDFTKTIIIPQNTFQAFLQLKDTERARMMKELFGLERFDLANKNKVLQERNTTETQILDNQITALGDISPQILKEKETQLIDNQQVLKDCQTRLDNQKQASLVLEKLKTDFVQLN